MSIHLKTVQISSTRVRFYSTRLNSIPFNAVQIQISSIQTRINSIQFQSVSSLITCKSIQLNSVSIATSIQNNSIRMQFNFISIPNQFDSRRFKIKSNSRHFNSTSNQFQFNFNSIKFISMKIDLLVPHNFSEGSVIQNKKFSPSARSRFFNIFWWPKYEHFLLHKRSILIVF